MIYSKFYIFGNEISKLGFMYEEVNCKLNSQNYVTI